MATLVRLTFIGLAGAIGLLTFIKTRGRGKGWLPLLLLGLFICLALVSATYSVEPRFTLVRTIEFIAFYCFLLGMYKWLRTRPRLESLLNITFYVITVSILVNASAAALFPQYIWHWRSPNRYQGLVGHPNTLGLFCLMAYPILLWKFRRAHAKVRAAIIVLSALAVAMHLMSGSRASMMAAGVGIFVWLLALRRKFLVTALAGLAILGLLLLPMLTEAIPSLQREYQGEKAATVKDLTGRTQFWQLAAQLIAEKPVAGYGYEVAGGVWSESAVSEGTFVSQWGSSKTSLHNGYLEVVLGTGILGLSLWLMVLFMPIPRLVMAPMSDSKAYVLMFMTQFLMLNFFESAISTSRSVGSLGFWLAWVMALCLPGISMLEAPVHRRRTAHSKEIEAVADA
jgi:O-antigen ligase